VVKHLAGRKEFGAMRTIRKVTLGFLWVLCAAATLCSGADLPRPQYPVIFIHGLAADAHLWDDLRDFLASHGWTNGGSPQFVKATYPTNDSVSGVARGTFYTMNMSDSGIPVFKSQTLSFSQQGYEVGKVISKVKSVTGQSKVILVGHSMGGLAARAYVEGQA
jgi:triacylglycerol lipase